MFRSIRNYSRLSSGPQGINGRVPLFQSDTSSSQVSITDPYLLYQAYIQQGILKKDEHQVRAMKEFQKLYHRIIDYKPPEELSIKISLLKRKIELKHAEATIRQNGGQFSPLKLSMIHNLFRADPEAEKKQLIRVMTEEEEWATFASPQGLLINGEVGCGKSMLMDIFASSLPHESKMRWHYNNFILWVFGEMHKIQHQRSMMATLHHGRAPRPLTMENEFVLFEIAQKMIAKNTVLMLDEFMLPDIAPANIVKLLFTYYFKLGGVLVATSNKLPEDLYSSQFHKSNFTAFVELLKARCHSVDMLSTVDYRASAQSSHQPHLVIKTDRDQNAVWWDLIRKNALKLQPENTAAIGDLAEPAQFTVHNRTTHIPWTFNDNSVAYLDFGHICQGLYSSSDYITLASRYPVVIVDNVPVLTTKMKNEARRFITLLDAVYECKCQFYMRSDVEVENLFFPDAAKTTDTSEDVQDQEMYARTTIDMTNPYRPNVALYEDKMETYAEEHRKVGVDFTKTIAFTGEDEKFAYKRAVSRIKEMVNSEVWREVQWVPIDSTMRPWETSDTEIGADTFGGSTARASAPTSGPTSGPSGPSDGPRLITQLHHFWAMGPWTASNGKRLKDSIARSWVRSSIRNQ